MAFLWRRKSLLTGLLPSCTNGQKLQESFPFSLSFDFKSMFPPDKTPPLWGHTHNKPPPHIQQQHQPTTHTPRHHTPEMHITHKHNNPHTNTHTPTHTPTHTHTHAHTHTYTHTHVH